MSKKQLFKKVDLVEDERGITLAKDLLNQFEELHNIDFYPIPVVEEIILKQQELVVHKLNNPSGKRPSGVIFSPSGASKCKRELFYKAKKHKAVEDRYPYQRRWTRNSTAVHEVVQKDLLHCEVLLPDPKFKVVRKNGLPAWEENLKGYKSFDRSGTQFTILGMMDGILEYKDGSHIGFEFKTKSTTIAAVGNYLMKGVKEEHKLQATAYSLLFGIDEYVFMYESVAKDGWTKGAEAKADVRTFYHKVTEEDRTALLDKFADVVIAVENDKLPAKEEDKCLFCQYKHLCMKEVE